MNVWLLHGKMYTVQMNEKMTVSYDKLLKLLIDKKMNQTD